MEPAVLFKKSMSIQKVSAFLRIRLNTGLKMETCLGTRRRHFIGPRGRINGRAVGRYRIAAFGH